MTDWLKETLQVLISSSVTSFFKFKCRIFGLFFYLSMLKTSVTLVKSSVSVLLLVSTLCISPGTESVWNSEEWDFEQAALNLPHQSILSTSPRTQMTQIMKSFVENSFFSLSNKLDRKIFSTKEQSRGFSGTKPSTNNLLLRKITHFPLQSQVPCMQFAKKDKEKPLQIPEQKLLSPSFHGHMETNSY